MSQVTTSTTKEMDDWIDAYRNKHKEWGMKKSDVLRKAILIMKKLDEEGKL